MKKLIKLLPMLLMAVIGSTMLFSCGDDKDEPISGDALPATAKTFIAQYFPSATILTAVKDKDEYEVTLSDGTRIDFNKAGEWTDVDAAIGQTIPTGFYPAAINEYVSTNFQSTGINEISKEKRGYDVELLTGMELVFNHDGVFVGYD